MKHQLNPLQAMVQICANDVIGCAKKKRDAAKKNCFRRISWKFIHLEPKWPLFWLEKALFCGVDLQK